MSYKQARGVVHLNSITPEQAIQQAREWGSAAERATIEALEARVEELKRKLEASTILNVSAANAAYRDVDTIDRLQTRIRELEDSVATALSLINAALDSSMLGTYPRADLQLARARLMRPQKPPLAPPEAPTEAQRDEKTTDGPQQAPRRACRASHWLFY